MEHRYRSICIDLFEIQCSVEFHDHFALKTVRVAIGVPKKTKFWF